MDPRTARRQASRRLGSVRLGPARRVSIRPIDAFDRLGLSALYASLSAESARRRFLGGRRVAEPELDDMVIGDGIVGVLRAPGRDDGAVVAHAQVCPEGPDSAEVAFAVRDDLQRQGIGRALVAAVVELARRKGWRRLTAVTYADNAAMRHLLMSAGCTIERDRIDSGVEEIVLLLPTATRPGRTPGAPPRPAIVP